MKSYKAIRCKGFERYKCFACIDAKCMLIILQVCSVKSSNLKCFNYAKMQGCMTHILSGL